MGREMGEKVTNYEMTAGESATIKSEIEAWTRRGKDKGAGRRIHKIDIETWMPLMELVRA